MSPRAKSRPARRGASRPSEAPREDGARPAGPGLDLLWSPWRMEYIRSAEEPAGCLFCRVGRSRADRSNLVLARTAHAMLMMNRFPYNPAHLMVAPLAHKASFGDLTAHERDEFMALTSLAELAIQAEYRPHGLNVGANLGRVAGAGFPGHLHLHLVPRWNGDTNFMPVIGATRVLPESLARTWSRLKRAIATALGTSVPRPAAGRTAGRTAGRARPGSAGRTPARRAGARPKAAGRTRGARRG